MQDWAEVHRLHEREGESVRTIARRLSMSRNTVSRLLRLKEPPVYEREQHHVDHAAYRISYVVLSFGGRTTGLTSIGGSR